MTTFDNTGNDADNTDPSEASDSNRTFLLVAGCLGGLVLLGLLCLAGYLFFRTNASQQNQSTAIAQATFQAATIQALVTQTAVAQSISQTAPATNTVPPANTAIFVETAEPATVTVAAALTQIAVSTQTLIPTSTALPGSIATSNATVTLTPTALVPTTPALTLFQTASSQTYSQVGQTITFAHMVTNGGAAPLGPAQFTITANTLSAPINCGPPDITLAPGQTLTCSSSYIITQADLSLGSLTSTATVSGGGLTSAPASVTVINLGFVPSAIPATGQAPTTTPGGMTSVPGTPTPDASATSQLTQDLGTLAQATLTNLPKASYVYAVPETLKLNDSHPVELRMSRSLTGEQLSTLVVTANALSTSTSDPGVVVSTQGPEIILGGGQVEITRLMKAELKPEDGEAFDVQLLTDEIQVLNPNSTVTWRWTIKAKKAGKQNLIFVISQQADLDRENRWLFLQSETRTVEVNVTFDQRLGALDWKWISGTIITLVGIAALLRWVDQLQRRPKSAQRSRHKRSDVSQHSTPEGLLARLPGISKPGNAVRKTQGHIFISYRRSDSADIAGRIYDRLIDEFGPDLIFKDVDSIPLGADFKKDLDKRVSECSVLLAIIGDRWVDAKDETGKKRLDDRADFVRVEIESALKRDIPVIPLLVRDAQMPSEEDLPYSLRRLVFQNGIPIRPDPDFHNDMDRLISALHEYI